MADKFVSHLIKDFFDTGTLKCDTYQLFAIKHYVKDRLKELEDVECKTVEYQMWLNFYEIIITYLTETQITLSGANEEMKVTFNDYLSKVYGISEGEIDSTTGFMLYNKYSDFIEKNCCSKCLYFGIPTVCSNCPCSEIYIK